MRKWSRAARMLVALFASIAWSACEPSPKTPAPVAREDASASASASAGASAGASASASATPPPDAIDASVPDARARVAIAPAPADMLLVPGGTFVMGADDGGEGDEHPAHPVTLAAFFLDKTEVTNDAYAFCVTAKVCPPKESRADFERPQQPAVFVGWEDAKTFCAWTKKRLPREAEFERAIRDDDGRTYPWGNDPPAPDKAVYARASPLEVGSKPAGRGPHGHDDLAGNVWEWMEDEYDPFAYTRASAHDGKPGTCPEILVAQDQLRKEKKQGFTGSNAIPRVCEHSIRGGAFNYGGNGLRATNRVHHAASFRIKVLGFRCAKDAP
jgi:formylglycine-generating enzyme required for sulfatase activity